MSDRYENPNQWTWYHHRPSTRVGMSGPALEMWKPRYTERIATMHPSRKLRLRKSGRVTTKVPNGV